jgi:hypothetical protein
MSSILDVGEDAGIGQEGEGSSIGEDEVDARSGDGALGVDVLVGPGQWARVEGGMDINPSTTGAQEVGEKRARRPALSGNVGEVLRGAKGAIEVADKECGYLEVEGMRQLDGGVDEPLTQNCLSMLLQRDIKGEDEESLWQGGERAEPNSMEAAHGIEHSPCRPDWPYWGGGHALVGDKTDPAGPTVHGARQGGRWVSMVQVETQSFRCGMGTLQGQRGQMGFLEGHNVQIQSVGDGLHSIHGPMGQIPTS